MVVKVKSGKGFYLGDVCYVLNDEVYHGVWGKAHYEDGAWEDPKTGLQFAVAGTAYGDGEYVDGENHVYGVDAGVIGLVPLEMVGKTDGLELGRVFISGGEATFEAENGVFFVEMPNGEHVIINTNEEETEDEDWYGEIEEGFAEDEVGFDPYLGCYTDDV